jgi:hypothetical protein
MTILNLRGLYRPIQDSKGFLKLAHGFISSKKYTDDIKKEKQPKKYFLHAVPKKLKIMLFWNVYKN